MKDGFHKILAKQIEKFIDSTDKDADQLNDFLEAVDKTYKCLEEEKRVLTETLEKNSRELVEANKKLKEQVETQRGILEDLQAALIVLDEDNENLEKTEDPKYLSRVLVRIIAQHAQVEEQLKARTTEMEFINKSMIGRELKMVDLKKEIIELKKKLDQKSGKKNKE